MFGCSKWSHAAIIAQDRHSGPLIIEISISRGFDPACSPDGRQIAFAASESANQNVPSHIFVMDVDGANKKQLTFGDDIGRFPSWSPDGGKTAFGRADRIGTVDVNTQEVIYPFDNSQWQTYDLVWSPINPEIVFHADIYDFANAKLIKGGLYISSPDGTKMKRLTNGYDYGPDWSPDRQSIVFLHREARDSPDILRIMRTDGSIVQDIDLPARMITNATVQNGLPMVKRSLFQLTI